MSRSNYLVPTAILESLPWRMRLEEIDFFLIYHHLWAPGGWTRSNTYRAEKVADITFVHRVKALSWATGVLWLGETTGSPLRRTPTSTTATLCAICRFWC